ncbi:hypothetical protein ACQ4PT_021729 [Festuca glaucescens]
MHSFFRRIPDGRARSWSIDMEKDAVLVCTILGFLGSVAVTLGFVANYYSSKAWTSIPNSNHLSSTLSIPANQICDSILQSVAYDGTHCVYRSPPAIGCGILGVFLVLINQVIVAAYTSGAWCLCVCRCCCPCWTKRRRAAPPSKRRRLSIILSMFSWLLTIVAIVIFSLGVSENSREEPPISKTPTSYECRDPERIGNFPTASLSSLIAVVLGIASYMLLETAAPETPPHGFFGLEIAGTSTGQPSQLQTGPTTGAADQEADHISLATAV